MQFPNTLQGLIIRPAMGLPMHCKPFGGCRQLQEVRRQQ